MSVHIKKNGLVYCVHYANDGNQVWEPFGRGEDARRQAEERDLEIRLQKKRTGMAPRAIALNFAELAQDYIDYRHIELADSTRDGILRCLARYAMPIIGRTIVSSITLNHWHAIQKSMIESGLGAVTINTYFKYLSHILTWSITQRTGILADHPWRKRTPLRETKRFRVDLLTVAEFIALRDAAAPHLAWVMEVAYHTGARVGPKELFSLQWKDVDFERCSVEIVGKGGGRRTQFVNAGFAARMKAEHEAQKQKYPACPWVCSYNGRQIKSIKRAWKTALSAAGISRRVRPYDMRHLHITYALAMGADIEGLAKRVGHTSSRMIVNVYSHLAKDLIKAEAFPLPDISKKHAKKALDGVLDEKKGPLV